MAQKKEQVVKTVDASTVQPGEVNGAPQGQVQYVMMEKSLKGVGGWLIFWIIVFALAAIGYIAIFFESMTSLSAASSIVSLIFSPLLAAGYTASVVLISMQKRLAKLITYITLGVSAIYAIVNSIVDYATGGSSDGYYSSYGSSENSVPMLIAGILIAILMYFLVALYFMISRRAKETLVN